MSRHDVTVRLVTGGSYQFTASCGEPEGSPCRITCENGCETVSECEGECESEIEGECPEGKHCAFCRGGFRSCGCHIVLWLTDMDLDESYEGPDRSFQFPVEVDWREEGCTWSLPENPTIREVSE